MNLPLNSTNNAGLTRSIERILAIAVALGTFAICLLFSEAIIRKLDGYELFSMQIRPSSVLISSPSSGNSDLPERVRGYATTSDLAEGVKIEMFDQEPSLLPLATPAEWKNLSLKLPQGPVSFDMFKLWNSRFVASQVCESQVFRKFPDHAFVFDPPDGSPHPRYRFIPNSTTPLGLVTNQFGWRGGKVNWKKASRVIRIAFVGASTTVQSHGYPSSYPELIGHWLNLWAKYSNLNVSFETLNLGREGISSPDIAAVVRHEAVPMQPDLVVYYEGSNQFNIGSIVKNIAQQQRTGTETADNDHRFLTAVGQYSAMARRFQSIKVASSLAGETPKPEYEVEWPSEVDEFNPPLDSPKLPISLPIILKDLESIRSDLDRIDSKLVLSSFNWNVHDGMKLDPVLHKSIRDYLDIGMYPYKYRDIERLSRFQNRVFQKYAESKGLPYIQVAEKFPADPDLFIDPIHENYLGVKLRAWLVLQQIIPIIKKDLAGGFLPRPWSKEFEVRSAAPFPQNVRTVKIGCSHVAPDSSSVFIGYLPLSKLYADNQASEVKAGVPSRIRTAGKKYAYAAKIPTDSLTVLEKNAAFWVDLEVKSGAVQIGLLSKDGSRFVRSDVINSARGRVMVPLTLGSDFNDVGELVVANGLDRDESSTALLYSIKLYKNHKRNSFLGGSIGSGVIVPPEAQ
jgi:hypothetical protein